MAMNSTLKFLKGCALTLLLCLLTWLSPGLQSAAIAESGRAVIRGTSESGDVTGIVNFLETDAGLKVEADLTNAPSGTHGFHIHEFGSCAEEGSAAGGHYNPDGVAHGKLKEDGFVNAHAGDLGNIVAEKNNASYNETLPGLKLSGGKYTVAGRAVIVHEHPDDFGQPTGHAGPRIGCGEIFITSTDD